ncbi:MAG: hypothetical protein JWL90_1106 [Chthoniobacteraceae bacterium]|nr:hypothetical protein [Chthoniobacteraceae bacterium]
MLPAFCFPTRRRGSNTSAHAGRVPIQALGLCERKGSAVTIQKKRNQSALPKQKAACNLVR